MARSWHPRWDLDIHGQILIFTGRSWHIRPDLDIYNQIYTFTTRSVHLRLRERSESDGGVAVLRRGGCYGAAAWRVLGVAAWKVLWRGGLAGRERENEIRRKRMKWERDQTGKWGFGDGSGRLGFFFSLNINGRVGEYPLDKKHKTRGPPDTRIRKIIKSSIRPCTTHGRAAGRTGWTVLSGGSVFTGFCLPLLVLQVFHKKKIVYYFKV